MTTRIADSAENMGLVTATTVYVTMGSGPTVASADYWIFGCMTCDYKASTSGLGKLTDGFNLLSENTALRPCELPSANVTPFMWPATTAEMFVGGS